MAAFSPFGPQYLLPSWPRCFQAHAPTASSTPRCCSVLSNTSLQPSHPSPFWLVLCQASAASSDLLATPRPTIRPVPATPSLLGLHDPAQPPCTCWLLSLECFLHLVPLASSSLPRRPSPAPPGRDACSFHCAPILLPLRQVWCSERHCLV